MDTSAAYELCLVKSVSFELLMDCGEDALRDQLLDQEASREDVAEPATNSRDQQQQELPAFQKDVSSSPARRSLIAPTAAAPAGDVCGDYLDTHCPTSSSSSSGHGRGDQHRAPISTTSAAAAAASSVPPPLGACQGSSGGQQEQSDAGPPVSPNTPPQLGGEEEGAFAVDLDAAVLAAVHGVSDLHIRSPQQQQQQQAAEEEAGVAEYECFACDSSSAEPSAALTPPAALRTASGSSSISLQLRQRALSLQPQRILIPDDISEPPDSSDQEGSASQLGSTPGAHPHVHHQGATPLSTPLGSPHPQAVSQMGPSAPLGGWGPLGLWPAAPGMPMSPQALQLDHVNLEVIDDLPLDPTRLRLAGGPGQARASTNDLRRAAICNRSSRSSIGGSPAAAGASPHASTAVATFGGPGGYHGTSAPLFLSDAERLPLPLPLAASPARPAVGVASILLQASPQPPPTQLPAGLHPSPAAAAAAAAGGGGGGGGVATPAAGSSSPLPATPRSPQAGGSLPPPVFAGRSNSMPASPVPGAGSGTPGSSTGMSSTPRYGLHGASPLSPSRPSLHHPITPTGSYLRGRSQSGMRESWGDGRRVPDNWLSQHLFQMMPPQLRAVADLGAAAAASDSWRGSHSRRTSLSSISASQLGDGGLESEGTPTAASTAASVAAAGSSSGGGGGGGAAMGGAFTPHWQQQQQQQQAAAQQQQLQGGAPGSLLTWLHIPEAAFPLQPAEEGAGGMAGSAMSSPVAGPPARGSIRLPPGLHFYSSPAAPGAPGGVGGAGPAPPQLSVSANYARPPPPWEGIHAAIREPPGPPGAHTHAPHHHHLHEPGLSGMDAWHAEHPPGSPRPSRLNPSLHLLHPGPPTLSTGLGSGGSLVSPTFPGPVVGGAQGPLPPPGFSPRHAALLAATENRLEADNSLHGQQEAAAQLQQQQHNAGSQCGTPTAASSMARPSPLSPAWRGPGGAPGQGGPRASATLGHVTSGGASPAVFPVRSGLASPSAPPLMVPSRFAPAAAHLPPGGASASSSPSLLGAAALPPDTGLVQHPHTTGPPWATLQQNAAGGELQQLLTRSMPSSRASSRASTGSAGTPVTAPGGLLPPGAAGVPPQRAAAALLGQASPQPGISELLQDRTYVEQLLQELQGVDRSHPLVCAMLEALKAADASQGRTRDGAPAAE